MIDLVADGLGEQSVGLELAPTAVLVLGANGQCDGTLDGGEEARERETALLEAVFPLAVDDRREPSSAAASLCARSVKPEATSAASIASLLAK